MKTKLGTELHPNDQKHVLAAFVHRYTGEHKPQWAQDALPDGTYYPVQFKDDQDWLANTRFAVCKDGRLNHKVRECESNPTWPNGMTFTQSK